MKFGRWMPIALFACFACAQVIYGAPVVSVNQAQFSQYTSSVHSRFSTIAPSLTDARPPLPHIQAASTITGLAAVATSGSYSDLTDKPVGQPVTITAATATDITGFLHGNGAVVSAAANSGHLATIDQGLATTNTPAFAGLKLPNAATITLGDVWGSGALTFNNGVTTFGVWGAAGLQSNVVIKAHDGTSLVNPGYGFRDEYGIGIGRMASSTLGFITNNAERVRLDGNGNVGIGTSLFGTSARKVLALGADGTTPTTSPTDTVQLWSGDVVGDGTAGLQIRAEDGTRHVFGPRVGIGTAAPDRKLDVALGAGESARFGGWEFEQGWTGVLKKDGFTVLSVNSGTSEPLFGGRIYVPGGATGGVSVGSSNALLNAQSVIGSSAYGAYLFGYDGIQLDNRSFYGAPTTFTFNGVEAARFTPSGLTLASGANIKLPDTTNAKTYAFGVENGIPYLEEL